jgi:hypothetical protein
VWEPLGEGVVDSGLNPVTSLAVEANNDVIVGGYSTGVYNTGRVAVTVNSIARWNGTSWSALGQGLTGPAGTGVVSDIAIDNTGRIYVTGVMTTATNGNGMRVNGPLVYWEGGQWHSINVGAPLQAVGGAFTMAINPDGSTVSVSNIAYWDRTQRRCLPVGSGLNGAVYAL